MKASPTVSPSSASGADGPLAALFSQAEPVEFDAKRTIFHAGDSCDGIYHVVDGLLKVTVLLPSRRERILSIVGPGALIGEVSAVDRGPRSASVTTIRPSKLLFVSLPAFDRFADAHPDIYREVAALLARRLRGSNTTVTLDALSVKAKAARAVLSLADAFGKDVGAGRILVRQKMSQGELAAMAGIARENLSRILQDWIRNGLLSRLASYYCVEDKAALAREADV